MNTGVERTRSIWMDTQVCAQAPMLDQDVTVDAVIVGSGIAGLSVAAGFGKRPPSIVYEMPAMKARY
jgi:ribulose 1,5-bisphosphate synthetase/thiazole synthase